MNVISFKSNDEIAHYIGSLDWVRRLNNQKVVDMVVKVVQGYFGGKKLEFESVKFLVLFCANDIEMHLFEDCDQFKVDWVIKHINKAFYVGLTYTVPQ
ncbi:hypothetical protein K0U07_01265 [bacterium]|nr:hypothetical protein [bacterium]